MIYRTISLAALVFLAACSTPIITMKKGDEFVNCGGGTAGSIVGGMIGYRIQEGNDRECVMEHASRGYKIVTPAR